MNKMNCDECGSPFFTESSKMSDLCPECSSKLYGYENCSHSFEKGNCRKCGWDGSVSKFLNKVEGKGES